MTFECTVKMQMMYPEEDCFNKSIIKLLTGQQDVQKQSLYMMQSMTRCHDYDNLMRDITVHDGKNMDLAGWVLQIKKVVEFKKSQE